jgi:glycosyltransferase involved in cell wall biosynthesis
MVNSMRIALIADAYPPMRTSGAVQLRDLAQEMVRQGHFPTVMIPSPNISTPWLLENMSGVQVLRLRAPRTKDVGYVRRAINEFVMPFAMLRNLRKSPFSEEDWDGVVWYSPTIFLGPIVNALKKASTCQSYLILRDVFPDWAVDMGLLTKGLPYRFFKVVERYQYSVANVIGVQTPANLPYFDRWNSQPEQRIEVLQNWLSSSPNTGCSISVSSTLLAGRTIFVYAGNMGVAQGMGILIDLAEKLRDREDIGFLLVGRGSDVKFLREDVRKRGLNNVVFHDEIDPSEIPGLYAQCHIGIVVLDPRHKTQNIPGKFLSYMRSGLPVLASINPHNDLEKIIKIEGVGRVCTDHSVDTLQRLAEELLVEISSNSNISIRCRALSDKLFSPEVAVKQIIEALAQAS